MYCEPLSEVRNSCLCARICGNLGKRSVCVHRRDVKDATALSSKHLCLLEAARHLKEIYEKHRPDLMPIVAFEELNATVLLMQKILFSFSYRKCRSIYKELETNACMMYADLKTRYPNEEGLMDVARFAVHHKRLFFVKCIVDACLARLRRLFKKVLIRLRKRRSEG